MHLTLGPMTDTGAVLEAAIATGAAVEPKRMARGVKYQLSGLKAATKRVSDGHVDEGTKVQRKKELLFVVLSADKALRDGDDGAAAGPREALLEKCVSMVDSNSARTFRKMLQGPQVTVPWQGQVTEGEELELADGLLSHILESAEVGEKEGEEEFAYRCGTCMTPVETQAFLLKLLGRIRGVEDEGDKIKIPARTFSKILSLAGAKKKKVQTLPAHRFYVPKHVVQAYLADAERKVSKLQKTFGHEYRKYMLFFDETGLNTHSRRARVVGLRGSDVIVPVPIDLKMGINVKVLAFANGDASFKGMIFLVDGEYEVGSVADISFAYGDGILRPDDFSELGFYVSVINTKGSFDSSSTCKCLDYIISSFDDFLRRNNLPSHEGALVFLDGAAYHKTASVTTKLASLSLDYIHYPANSTGFAQPHDTNVFPEWKGGLRMKLTREIRHGPGRPRSAMSVRSTVYGLAMQTYLEVCTEKTFQSALKQCGLVSFNADDVAIPGRMTRLRPDLFPVLGFDFVTYYTVANAVEITLQRYGFDRSSRLLIPVDSFMGDGPEVEILANGKSGTIGRAVKKGELEVAETSEKIEGAIREFDEGRAVADVSSPLAEAVRSKRPGAKHRVVHGAIRRVMSRRAPAGSDAVDISNISPGVSDDAVSAVVEEVDAHVTTVVNVNVEIWRDRFLTEVDRLPEAQQAAAWIRQGLRQLAISATTMQPRAGHAASKAFFDLAAAKAPAGVARMLAELYDEAQAAVSSRRAYSSKRSRETPKRGQRQDEEDEEDEWNSDTAPSDDERPPQTPTAHSMTLRSVAATVAAAAADMDEDTARAPAGSKRGRGRDEDSSSSTDEAGSAERRQPRRRRRRT